MLCSNGCAEGYEGNPQSFRIVTRLAVRADEHEGLDLSRATLAAMMKYPWLKEPDHPERSKKWAAYQDDAEAFNFAREGLQEHQPTLEARIMDYADDIAYSVHDLEDFYRAGLVSWLRLFEPEPAPDVLLKAEESWHARPNDAAQRIEDAACRIRDRILPLVPSLFRPFQGGREQRQELRFFTSKLIGRLIFGATVSDDGMRLEIQPEHGDEIRFLKAITRTYVIDNTALAAQQYGQRRVLQELFTDLLTIAHDKKRGAAFPHRTRHLLDDCWTCPPRVVADTIASMTEEEVVALHRRLRGVDGGTVLNPIVR